MALRPDDCGPHGKLLATVMYASPEKTVQPNLPWSAVVVAVVVTDDVAVVVSVVAGVVVAVVVGVVRLHSVNVPSWNDSMAELSVSTTSSHPVLTLRMPLAVHPIPLPSTDRRLYPSTAALSAAATSVHRSPTTNNDTSGRNTNVLQLTGEFGAVQVSLMRDSTAALLSHSCGDGNVIIEPLTPGTVLQVRRPRTGVVVAVVVAEVVALVVAVVVALVVTVVVADVVAVDVGVVVAVGAPVGDAVGADVGFNEGAAVGCAVGVAVGADVGWAVGEALGAAVGASVGVTDGAAVGLADGAVDGANVNPHCATAHV